MKPYRGLIAVFCCVVACSKGEQTDRNDMDVPRQTITVRARGLVSQGAKKAALAHMFAQSVSAPTGDEYAGMGVNYGEAVVDGLRIRLLGVGIDDYVPGMPHEQATHISVGDWSVDPQVLEIAEGYSGVVSATNDQALKVGLFNKVSVSFESNYDLKAYAYMDTDQNGQIDTTIFTTASGVRKTHAVLAPGSMPDYDYYHYGFTYLHNADSKTASTTSSGMNTLFPAPLSISTETREIVVDLLIDSFHVVRAWDGRVGDGASLPGPGYPFPASTVPSRGANEHGLSENDLFPIGEPAFGLFYVPVFAFPREVSGGDTSPSYYAETYQIAPNGGFDLALAQTLTVAFDPEGEPVLGYVGGLGENPDSLHLGQAARLFEKLADGSYRFYTDGGPNNEAGGFRFGPAEDGGLIYSNDPKMAGHIVEGFRPLALGEKATFDIKDGPRCNGEYDYCVATRLADGDPGVRLVDGVAIRTGHILRVR